MTWLFLYLTDCWLVSQYNHQVHLTMEQIRALPNRYGYQSHPDERPHLMATKMLEAKFVDATDANYRQLGFNWMDGYLSRRGKQ